jgi:hypothetical protein
VEPIRERPYIAHPEYGVPKHSRGLIAWEDVVERFKSEQTYWVCTSSPEGTPHVRPVWGVFANDMICFGGGPETKWSRTLAVNPEATVHLESGTNVAIAEGTVDRIADADDPRLKAVDDAYQIKYDMRHGPPIWVLSPRVVLAWSNCPKDMTRFRCESH